MRAGTKAAVLFLALGLASSACGASGPTRARSAAAGRSASPSPGDAAGGLVGLVAVGHSGLTGYASDHARLHGSAPQNSWATGTNPVVNSIYQRLRKAEPAIGDHVANAAINGSNAGALQTQLQTAFLDVPHPQLVIMQTIDNDVTCDGKDDANHAVFGQQIRAALDDIVKQSPQTKILTFAQFGRPAGYAASVAHSADAVANFEGDGMCDGYDASGHVVPAHIANITHILEGYERVLADTCHQVPQCHYTDVSTHYVDRLEYLAKDDWDHESVAGHAQWAALMWPVVAQLLGLPVA